MITINAVATVTSFRKSNLFQLSERFDAFITRLYLTKFIT